jgi:hypothetical protein
MSNVILAVLSSIWQPCYIASSNSRAAVAYQQLTGSSISSYKTLRPLLRGLQLMTPQGTYWVRCHYKCIEYDLIRTSGAFYACSCVVLIMLFVWCPSCSSCGAHRALRVVPIVPFVWCPSCSSRGTHRVLRVVLIVLFVWCSSCSSCGPRSLCMLSWKRQPTRIP